MTVGRTTMAVYFSCYNMAPQILTLLVLASLCVQCYAITLATYRPPTGRQKVKVCHFSWVSLFHNEIPFRKHCHFRCDSLIPPFLLRFSLPTSVVTVGGSSAAASQGDPWHTHPRVWTSQPSFLLETGVWLRITFFLNQVFPDKASPGVKPLVSI